MKEEIKQVKTYIANDGKEFLNKEDCIHYEKELKKLERIQYFVVSHSPDLCETGCFTAFSYVAVDPEATGLTGEDIVMQWAIDIFGYLCQGVQGYRLMRAFCVSKCTKESYDSGVRGWDKKKCDKKIFISRNSVDGLPKPETQVFTKLALRYHAKI